MRPVTQRQELPPYVKTEEDIENLDGNLRGDCLRACFASLFELDLESVPHFVSQDDWYGALEDWLDEFGLYPIVHYVNPKKPTFTAWKGYYVVGGRSPRVGKHGCIGEYGKIDDETGWGWKVVWDPHPSRAGLVGDVVTHVYELRCFDPARRKLIIEGPAAERVHEIVERRRRTDET